MNNPWDRWDRRESGFGIGNIMEHLLCGLGPDLRSLCVASP